MANTGAAGGGIGQAAGDLVKEMQKAQAEVQKSDAGKQAGFSQALQAQGAGIQQQQLGLKVAQEAGLRAQQGRVVDARRLGKLAQRRPGVSTRVGSFERGEESKMAKMIQNLVSGQDKMTKIMNIALSGRQFSPSELLAMQAGVYRFSQELDLTSKVVEKATGGIKQTLNTQV